jgi:hypothetical protein
MLRPYGKFPVISQRAKKFKEDKIEFREADCKD